MRSLHFGCPAAALAHVVFPLAIATAVSAPAWAQSGPTAVQGAGPNSGQAGVSADGTGSGCGSPGFELPGNPETPVVPGDTTITINIVNVYTGNPSILEQDLYYPAEVPWIVGRSYNVLQYLTGGPDSNGYQGYNWFQTSQPEIVYDGDEDLIHLVYAADKYVTYAQLGTTTAYEGVNGAGGFFQFIEGDSETADRWVFTDMSGLESTFVGFDDDAGDSAGQLWTMRMPGSEAIAYVGSSSSIAAAQAANGWSSGKIQKAYDSSGREYVYSYDGTSGRLMSVVVSLSSAEVGRVEYTYHSGSTDHGLDGDLRTVTVTLPLGASGADSVKTKYYRYWKDSGFHATTYPGYPHQIKMVLDYEGARRVDWLDNTWDFDFDTMSDAALSSYAEVSLKYNYDRRVAEATFNGECGCSGGSSGSYAFDYQVNANFLGTSAYDNDEDDWLRRTVIRRPDGSYVTQYFDELHQPLSVVVSDINPASTSPAPTYWASRVVRNEFAQITEVWTPEAIAAYDHGSSGDLFTLDTSGSGLVHLYQRDNNATNGYLAAKKWCDAGDYANSALHYLEWTKAWQDTSAVIDIGFHVFRRPLLDTYRVYHLNNVSSGTSGSYLTSYAYTMHALNSFQIKRIEETLPTVSTGNNGSGATHKIYRQFRHDGQLAYRSEKTLEETGKQIIERRTYNAHAQLETVYTDANTTGLGLDAEFTSAGTPFNDAETRVYDAQGRVVTQTTHDNRTLYNYQSALGDRRIVSIQFPNYTTTSGGSYAVPARYTVHNHAGKVEFVGLIDASNGDYHVGDPESFIDSDESDPIAALNGGGIGDLTQIVTMLYDGSGARATESRTYFLTPTSGVGVDGTNYDPTLFHYDGMGRLIRRKEPHGTIYRTVYDARGLATQSWIGTNDNGLAGGSSSGTNDMVQTDATGYDVNGRVTSRSAYTESTTSSGEQSTIYHLDLRGRAIATVNPTAPHTVREFDNLGRVLVSAEYSSSSGVDHESEPTEAASRMALSESSYDERGRAWKSAIIEIDSSDGSIGESLERLTWYDELGRVIKVDGEQLTKYRYDRLGQRTHEFILAGDDDSVFADVDDVSGDTVLEERQTAFNANHQVWMTVRIDRLHTDVGSGATVGALDTNADNDLDVLTAGNVTGRVQITAYWYDDLSREKARAAYGTNQANPSVITNVDSFNRVSIGATVATRSDTVLVTTTAYGEDGQVRQVTDPKNIAAVYEYDQAGRKTAEIANHVSLGTGVDENQTVRYAYTDGLMVSLTADLPSGETDQVTTYTFGTIKGTSAGDSRIATGHLLQKETYPDSANSDDVVRFAYNAQGQEIWRKDQAGNVIETDFDPSGRVQARKATTIDTAFDDDVQLIQSAYDALGRIETVTQRASTAVDGTTGVPNGTVVDQVKYVYDGWGNLRRFRQDHDSAVGAGGGSLPAEEIEYTFEKATTGRNTIRRTGLLLPDGEEFVFAYSTASTSLDNAASRVTTLQDGVGTDLAAYRYNGAGHLVSTYLAEPDIYSSLYGASGSAFGSLDRFNRVIGSKWTKDISSDVDFFSVAVGYDRNSNVTHQDDLIFGGLDAKYTNDGLNRLTRAHEGTLSSGSITSPTRDQQWTLNQTGNWNRDKVDLNGDGDFFDAGEVDDDRTHNVVNELVGRDTDNNGADNHTLLYDAAGNMTDDGVYKYEWDAFYRLRRVRNQSNDLICEYWYNGLGFLIIRHQDTDGSGKADGSDKKYHTYYDERWRQIATFREDDTLPKEQFVYHCAGNGGWGGSSYIDSTLLRDKDQSTAWTAQADRTDTRAYYCQNWRADVVVMVDDTGEVQESARYSAYGVPFGLPNGDADGDGDCDTDDLAVVTQWIANSTYSVRGDFNLDGVLDGKDELIATENEGAVHGRGVLSDTDFGNRKGYAGYEGDAKLSAKWHVRYRVLDSVLGRWLSRDPAGYVDGLALYEYARSGPWSALDPTGLLIEPACVQTDCKHKCNDSKGCGPVKIKDIQVKVGKVTEKGLASMTGGLEALDWISIVEGAAHGGAAGGGAKGAAGGAGARAGLDQSGPGALAGAALKSLHKKMLANKSNSTLVFTICGTPCVQVNCWRSNRGRSSTAVKQRVCGSEETCVTYEMTMWHGSHGAQSVSVWLINIFDDDGKLKGPKQEREFRTYIDRWRGHWHSSGDAIPEEPKE